MTKYINAKTFEEFCFNQDRLIDVLNHRMTDLSIVIKEIRTDVTWLKKLLWVIVGVSVSIFASTLIKFIGGG